MTITNPWHDFIASRSRLRSQAHRELSESGFIVLPGPVATGNVHKLSEAYDRAVAAADPADVHVSKTGYSTRVNDLVNSGTEFDSIYIYPPLLAACCQVINGPFKLSGMRARTLHPGAAAEELHVDVKYRAKGWPLVGCILMVDPFEEKNGATRFVPGSHLRHEESPGSREDPQETVVPGCGPAGSVIIFNASVWHGHGANASHSARRSIQAHFVPRDAEASADAPSRRMRPETMQRISDLAKYVLNVRTTDIDAPPHRP